MKVKVDCTIHGRNEVNNLPRMIESLRGQTHSFNRLIYIDDASTDGSADIAEKLGLEVVRLTKQHPSWLATPMLSTIVNASVEKVYETSDLDYFMTMPCDVVLCDNYLEFLLNEMSKNSKLVICSGVLAGEYSTPNFPRGAARLYDFNFWHKYVKRFPFSYTWETYPIYKAQMLGFKTKSFRKVKMEGLRPTTKYKVLYGYAMRELGYFPFYALARCLIPSLKLNKIGLKMLMLYLRSPYDIFDRDIQRYVRLYQCKQILNIFTNPKGIMKRVLR